MAVLAYQETILCDDKVLLFCWPMVVFSGCAGGELTNNFVNIVFPTQNID